MLTLPGLELSASAAWVKSPEVAAGAGLDQHKVNVAARFEQASMTNWRYALLEWARTDERDAGRLTSRLGTWLGEAGLCRAGVIGAARLEQTDRPEEEALADPFRTPRPPIDLSNLGLSRWTTLTLAVSSPALFWRSVSGRPFVEVARVRVAPGTPAGVFDADRRYGASRMWMLSAGAFACARAACTGEWAAMGWPFRANR